jgi:nitric oxide reductase large subunit
MVGTVNWAAIGAVASVLALAEAPMLLLATAAVRWVRQVDERLTRIEARGREHRAGD